MRNKLNPELKKDDRIVLVHMDGESLGAGIKGKVIGVENIPKFTSSDLGFQYRVEWYDENGKPFSMLSLIPETDAWIIDTDYEVESLQAPNKRAKIEKRANSLKYFIILILIQFVNRKKEVKKIAWGWCSPEKRLFLA